MSEEFTLYDYPSTRKKNRYVSDQTKAKLRMVKGLTTAQRLFLDSNEKAIEDICGYCGYYVLSQIQKEEATVINTLVMGNDAPKQVEKIIKKLTGIKVKLEHLAKQGGISDRDAYLVTVVSRKDKKKLPKPISWGTIRIWSDEMIMALARET